MMDRHIKIRSCDKRYLNDSRVTYLCGEWSLHRSLIIEFLVFRDQIDDLTTHDQSLPLMMMMGDGDDDDDVMKASSKFDLNNPALYSSLSPIVCLPTYLSRCLVDSFLSAYYIVDRLFTYTLTLYPSLILKNVPPIYIPRSKSIEN